MLCLAQKRQIIVIIPISSITHFRLSGLTRGQVLSGNTSSWCVICGLTPECSLDPGVLLHHVQRWKWRHPKFRAFIKKRQGKRIIQDYRFWEMCFQQMQCMLECIWVVMILQMWVEFKEFKDPFLYSTVGQLSRLTFPTPVLSGKEAAVAVSPLQIMALRHGSSRPHPVVLSSFLWVFLQ